jgi:crossover junction endodeoxyribonuclease RusA
MELPWPPSVNGYWHMFPGQSPSLAPAGKKFRRHVAALALASGIVRKQGMLAGNVAVDVIAFPPDRKVRDIDNLLKALLDALTHARIWNDDRQVADLRIRRGCLAPRGKLTVTISTLNPEGKPL